MPLLATPRSRSLVTLPVPRRVAWDDFTDADGTALTSHTMPGGGTWTRHTGSAGAGDPTIDTNRVHNQNDANARYHYVTGVTFADGVVAGDFIQVTDNNLSAVGVIGRMVTGATTFYIAEYTTNGNLWRLFKCVATVFTQLGSGVNEVLTSNRVYRLELRMRGDRIALARDNEEIIVANDTAITAAGVCGMQHNRNATASVGAHLDNFEARAF